MNYVDIIVGQEPSYFIICIYCNDEKKLLEVTLPMDFNY